jgi:PAS domain S-box-containing protein
VTDAENVELRVLVLAPTAKDAVLTRSILERAGVTCVSCDSMPELRERLVEGAGAVLLAEEAIADPASAALTKWLAAQPPWSDLPLIVLGHPGANSDALAGALEYWGNVSVIERPMRLASFVSAVRTALRARERQYQIRDQLLERERASQTRALLAAIVESSDDAIVSKTLEGRILTWNDGAERIFGYTADEAIGQHIRLLIPPERHDEERTILQRLRRGERLDHFETVRVTKDGRRIDVSLTVSPIRNEQGEIIGASKVARDITHRKQAEQALREADRRKDEFLAVLAHELRNPLAPIRNSLQILRLSNRNVQGVEQLSEILERQVNHMVRLVDDLLEVSRITRGKIELRRGLVDLEDVVRSAVETSRPLLEAARHDLQVMLPPEPLTVEGDSVRLAQVLANLLNNAAKYTDEGGRIRLEVRREANWAVIAVRDNGTGIPADMLTRVFELFTQADRHSRRAQGGLGIGLTLVKTLVEMHGGTVQAHSEGPGRGSEFVVRLPVAVAQPSTQVQNTAPRSAPSSVLAPRHVLVVDDNRDAAESLVMLLKLLGADAQVAYSGADALAAIAIRKPAVVLLDVGMPDMDGHEVARRIRRQPELQDVTLVALTGWGQEEDRRQSRSAGFDYHLIKPADLTALETLLVCLESDPNGERITP